MEIVNYLSQLFAESKSYSCINSHKSAICQTLVALGKQIFLKNYTISKFMKGVFNLRPPLPRYTFIWDVKEVLAYLSQLFPLTDLPLKELTLKCVALVALSTAHRAQTLIALDLSLMKCDNNIVTFNTRELFKTSRPKHMSPDVKIYSFHRKEICPVYTLKHYIIKTKHFRKSNKLFVSYKTFKNVTTSTIARWLRDVLTLAGIDVSKFKAHSYRSASTSAASRAGLSLAGILKTANWSSAGTFQKFYHKEIKKSANYTESVFS